MPAKDTVLLHLSDTEATTKLIRKDVDNLVQNIKDNLSLECLRIENSEYTIPKILLKRLDIKFCELSELVAGC